MTRHPGDTAAKRETAVRDRFNQQTAQFSDGWDILKLFVAPKTDILNMLGEFPAVFVPNKNMLFFHPDHVLLCLNLKQSFATT